MSRVANYGWPKVTLGTDYNSYKWNDNGIVGNHDGYQQPVFAWVPSIGVSNLLEVKGFDKRWDGDLLVTSLKAQTLFRLRLNHDRVVYSEPIWIGQRLRDIAQLAGGTIALWTDDSQILFLSPDGQRLASNRRLPQGVDERIVSACMFCHHFGVSNSGDTAPSLTNLLGRKIGSDNYRYSESPPKQERSMDSRGLEAISVQSERFRQWNEHANSKPKPRRDRPAC